MTMSLCATQACRRILDVRNIFSVCKRIPQDNCTDWLEQQQKKHLPNYQQVRGSRGVKRRHTTQPFWHAAVTRTLYPEHISPENEEFLSEVVSSQYKDESPLQSEPWPRGEWLPKSQRCGLVGKKLGQYPMWKKDGTRLLATVIHVSDNHVINYVPASELLRTTFKSDVRLTKRPRGALIVGADSADPRLFTREYFNMFEKCGVMPKKKLTKFLVTDNAILQPGTRLHATHFRPGDRIDIQGYSIDHGFQGVVKRWGFHGGPKGHGSTKFHNKGGHIGCGGDRSIVMPGKKMPGHMGMEFVTIRGSRILRINSKFDCIWVNGYVPGAIGGYLNLYDSGLFHYRYRDPDNHPPFPTHYPAEEPVAEVDWYADDIHQFKEETITFEAEPVAATGKKK